jgi:hypothetical protein
MTAAEVAREIGVNDSTVYSWLLGQARPAKPKRIIAFLDSHPKQNGSGMSGPLIVDRTNEQHRKHLSHHGDFCREVLAEKKDLNLFNESGQSPHFITHLENRG